PRRPAALRTGRRRHARRRRDGHGQVGASLTPYIRMIARKYGPVKDPGTFPGARDTRRGGHCPAMAGPAPKPADGAGARPRAARPTGTRAGLGPAAAEARADTRDRGSPV